MFIRLSNAQYQNSRHFALHLPLFLTPHLHALSFPAEYFSGTDAVINQWFHMMKSLRCLKAYQSSTSEIFTA